MGFKELMSDLDSRGLGHSPVAAIVNTVLNLWDP
jgi:hypothetical protein